MKKNKATRLVTASVGNDLSEKLRNIAYRDDKPLSQVIREALTEFCRQDEIVHGPCKPRPSLEKE